MTSTNAKVVDIVCLSCGNEWDQIVPFEKEPTYDIDDYKCQHCKSQALVGEHNRYVKSVL